MLGWQRQAIRGRVLTLLSEIQRTQYTSVTANARARSVTVHAPEPRMLRAIMGRLYELRLRKRIRVVPDVPNGPLKHMTIHFE